MKYTMFSQKNEFGGFDIGWELKEMVDIISEKNDIDIIGHFDNVQQFIDLVESHKLTGKFIDKIGLHNSAVMALKHLDATYNLMHEYNILKEV